MRGGRPRVRETRRVKALVLGGFRGIIQNYTKICQREDTIQILRPLFNCLGNTNVH